MEIEYKWDMPDEALAERLLAHSDISKALSAQDTIRMRATYYDTPGQDVYHMGGGLRIRQENDESVCCLKLSECGEDGCKTRREYEVSAFSISEGLEKLPDAGAPRDACELLLANGPEPTCMTDFARRAFTLDFDAFSAELAIDKGEMRRQDRTAPINEIELEYLGGSQDAFHAFALQLQEEHGLVTQPRSKLARAITL